jgi:hypothetical protein
MIIARRAGIRVGLLLSPPGTHVFSHVGLLVSLAVKPCGILFGCLILSILRLRRFHVDICDLGHALRLNTHGAGVKLRLNNLGV